MQKRGLRVIDVIEEVGAHLAGEVDLRLEQKKCFSFAFSLSAGLLKMEEEVTRTSGGGPQVTHIVVVGFHHQLGPRVSVLLVVLLLLAYTHALRPERRNTCIRPLQTRTARWTKRAACLWLGRTCPSSPSPMACIAPVHYPHSVLVPRYGFSRLPMATEEDHSYFTLPSLPSQRPEIDLLYGVSCFRQVHTSVYCPNRAKPCVHD
jgi:hypothetical protein